MRPRDSALYRLPWLRRKAGSRLSVGTEPAGAGAHRAASHSSKAGSAQPVRQRKNPVRKSTSAATGGLACAYRVCCVLISHPPRQYLYCLGEVLAESSRHAERTSHWRDQPRNDWPHTNAATASSWPSLATSATSPPAVSPVATPAVEPQAAAATVTLHGCTDRTGSGRPRSTARPSPADSARAKPSSTRSGLPTTASYAPSSPRCARWQPRPPNL